MEFEREIALKLATDPSGGFSSVVEVLNAPADIVMQALHYQNFVSEYSATYMELNKK